MKIKKFLPIGLAALLSISLAGCSASSSDYAGEALMDNSMGFAETTMAAYGSPEGEYLKVEESFDGQVAELETGVEQKIIRNAEMTVQTLNLDETYRKLTDFLKNNGGSIFSEETYSNEFRIYTNATLKIPPENLDAFCEYAREVGTVTRLSIATDDITSAYYDTETRLRTTKETLEKYYEYLSQARDVEEMLMLQQQIDRITMEIESYEGQLKLWSAQVAQSTIRLEIEQVEDPSEIDIEDVEWDSLSVSNVGLLMKNGFIKCVNVLYSVFQWILIIIVTFSPIILIAGVIIFLSVRHNRKVRKNKPQTPVTPYIPPQNLKSSDENSDNKKQE
ncbi:MAG: DUF4349 domain-containing protein [Ruminococcus sp.]|jgi:hypothetical protein|nr:DUF4349 domain-containing protein [Ruminococcus sp.]